MNYKKSGYKSIIFVLLLLFFTYSFSSANSIDNNIFGDNFIKGEKSDTIKKKYISMISDLFVEYFNEISHNAGKTEIKKLLNKVDNIKNSDKNYDSKISIYYASLYSSFKQYSNPDYRYFINALNSKLSKRINIESKIKYLNRVYKNIKTALPKIKNFGNKYQKLYEVLDMANFYIEYKIELLNIDFLNNSTLYSSLLQNEKIINLYSKNNNFKKFLKRKYDNNSNSNKKPVINNSGNNILTTNIYNVNLKNNDFHGRPPFTAMFNLENVNINDVESVEWNFGDGEIVTSKTLNKTHIYRNSGKYGINVKLTLKNKYYAKFYTEVFVGNYY